MWSYLLLAATLFDQALAGLDEQVRGTEKGAGWPPGLRCAAWRKVSEKGGRLTPTTRR